MTFTTERPVRFAHVDAAGIVYYPRLFEMIDGAIEDWSRAAFGMGRQESHVVRRLGTPVVDIHTRFFAPSRLDEVLHFEVTVAEVGRSSLDLVVTVRCGEERRLEARVRQVLTDLDAMRAAPWPDEWRAGIEGMRA